LKKLTKAWTYLILLFSLDCFTFTLIEAQEISRYISGNIPIDNQNWNIYRNPVTGFVYFANSGGLGEYNGITMKMYMLPFRQSIRTVYISKEGRIFTGSFEEFGFWKDTTGGNLIYKSLSKYIDIEKNDEIWKIYEYKDKILFQSFTTIYCYDYKQVVSVKAPFTMLFLFNAGERLICQVLGNGLYWFNGKDFDFVKGSEMFKWIKIHSVLRNSDNELWICTANNGIYKFDGNRFVYFDSEISTFLKYQTCNAGVSISDSLFVFGTISDGIVYCDQYGKITRSFNYANGLKNNTVLSLFIDNTNGLWIGLDDGANYLNLTSSRTIYANLTGNLGTIYSILRDSDKLYLGTNHGLFEANISQINEDYTFSDIRLIPNTQEQVWTLERFGNQIICGHNDGTFLLDGGVFRQISDITGGWAIREYNDLLIEGTYTGIILFKKDANGKWTFRNKVKGFNEPTRRIEIDYLGYIWVSHPQKGFYRLELNGALDSIIQQEHYNMITERPTDINIYKINNQIVFTTSDSLYTFDYDQRKIIPFYQLNNTIKEYGETSQIIPEIKNRYWFLRGNKIALFEISKDFTGDKQIELSQKFSYLPERQIQIVRLSDKTILIPSRQAFETYNLSLIKHNPDSSKLKICKLVLQGKNKKNEISVDGPGSLKIPYITNHLTAFFSDPSGFDNESKTYLYRVEGIDEGWHTTTTDNLTYMNLPHGNYRLQVKPESGNQGDEIRFTIKRPWYLSTLAFILYLLIAAGSSFTTILRFRNRIMRHRKLLEFEVSNNKLASELDFRSYELMLTMRYLIQKDEILNDLNEQINAIKEQTSSYPVKFIREMEKIIRNGHTQAEEWKDSLNSLKLTQQGFFKRLIEKHPNLTPNDLRLCSYLRMNFATKEIARLLNISERAVEVSRYRLRRKMNLDHTVNLTEYLIKETD
jgi:DNA-binding CsgD family transcriptional regulator